MGWTGCHRPKGVTSLEFFKKEFGSGHYEFLDSAVVGEAFYAAVKHLKDSETGFFKKGDVFGMVCLIRHGKGEYNFHYKNMSESSGPYACDCPARIIGLLSLTVNAYALEWREECLHRHAVRAAVKGGMVARLTVPVHFSQGRVFRNFMQEGGKTFAVSLGDDGVFRKSLQVRMALDHGCTFQTALPVRMSKGEILFLADVQERELAGFTPLGGEYGEGAMAASDNRVLSGWVVAAMWQEIQDLRKVAEAIPETGPDENSRMAGGDGGISTPAAG
jgi:hypothetical protein